MDRPGIVRFAVALAVGCALALATATHAASAPDGFGKPRTVAPKGSQALATAVDSRGRITLVWERWVEGVFWVQTRQIAASGRPGPVHTLSPPGGSGMRPQVAVGPDGTATVVWDRQEGAHPGNFAGRTVQMTRVSPGGKPGPVTTLPQGTGDEGGPEVAVDAQGRAIVVWQGAGIEGVMDREGRRAGAGAIHLRTGPARDHC